MSKASKFLTTLVLGAAGGTAAAVFLASKTGKVLREKVTDYIKDYQQDPESKHAEWVDKAHDLKDQAVEKYSDVKNRFESGELTTDDIVKTVKEKAEELKERVTQEEFFAHLKDQVTKFKTETKEEVTDPSSADLTDVSFDEEFVSEDITIELDEANILVDESVDGI